ncbi:MAG: hypothetical protein JWM05_3281, partial [Acidimicrobiales bacterium]|nr:hypothetical protein [Acidimicrobiales bacterium]
MTRLLLPAAVLVWCGTTLVLSELRWFARCPLADRLRPYATGASPRPHRAGVLSVESFRDVVGPLALEIGGRLAR